MLDQARDAQFLVQPFPPAGLFLLLPNELRHPQRGRGLYCQAAQQSPIVDRVFLLAETGPQVQHSDELSLRHKRHRQLDPRLIQRIQCRRFQLQAIQLYDSACGLQVGHQRVVWRNPNRFGFGLRLSIWRSGQYPPQISIVSAHLASIILGMSPEIVTIAGALGICFRLLF